MENKESFKKNKTLKETSNIILGFDFGTVKIGMAIGNTVSWKASPLKIIREKSSKMRLIVARNEVVYWDPVLIVVGVPRYKDDSTHPNAERCKKFAENISASTKKLVRLEDESYTSVLSDGKGDDDARAATLILQGALDEIFHTA